MFWDSISFEIGAVLLLSAMLMWGTSAGFLPRMFRRSTAAPLIVAIAAIGFVAYRFGPELAARAGSLIPNLLPAPALSPSPAKPIAAAAVPSKEPSRPRRAPASPAEAQKATPAETNWKIVTLGDSVPSGAPGPAAVASAQPEARTPASNCDQYESRIECGAKRVGHALHILKKKDSTKP